MNRRNSLGVVAVGSKTLSRNMHFVRSEEEWSAQADLNCAGRHLRDAPSQAFLVVRQLYVSV